MYHVKKILHMVVRFAAQNLQSNNQSRFITTRQQSYGKVMFSVMSVIPFSRLLYDHYQRVATCQGNVREKTKFSPGRGKVREFWKNVREFGLLTHVKELSVNFAMLCQGIVREFFYDIFFRLKLLSRDLPQLCLC